MKIVNARPYEKEIQEKFWECWWNPQYQYYFGGQYRQDWVCRSTINNCARDFAVLDNEDNLIGVINYEFYPDVKLARDFGFINFYNNFKSKLIMGKALLQVVHDCFFKFGLSTIEFNVICGNPIEKKYDKLIDKYGGRILCQRRNRAILLDGTVADDKMYELTKEDYLRSVGRRLSGSAKGDY